MSVFRHELRQGRWSLAVWAAVVGALTAACLLLFPEMEGQMDAAGALFASMGRFTAAFGMDRLDIGTLTGFYAVECGNILGLGGALYAAMAGASALVKEQRGGTAELLLTHPVSRGRVAGEKLAAVLVQITVLNTAVLALVLLAAAVIGRRLPLRELGTMHGAYWLMQVQVACLCFGLSAFLRRGGAGAGMGLAAGLYVLELIANLSERAQPLTHAHSSVR